VDLVAAVARGVLGDGSPVDWQSLRRHCHVRELIGRIVPGYEKIAGIDRTREEFHVGGRLLREPRFPTASGRARFTPHSLPAPPADGTRLRLMTVRSEGQFNTVVYEEEDLYRGQERRDVILMNPADIARLGLAVDQRVTVRSEAGRMRNVLVRAFDIRSGNALMYFPEANALVPRALDEQSKTPAFKNVLVAVEAEAGPPADAASRVPLTLARA
jgi:anaerobic selenocysteine-containing dehydrogenase